MRVITVAMLATGCKSIGEWHPVEVRGGLLLLEAEVDDGDALRCLIDTGASMTVVRSDLSLGADPLLLIGDRDLPIDPLSHPDIDPILDAIGGSLGGIDCLLGWDSLRGSPFTIDYANAQIRLSPRGHRDRQVEETLGDELTVPLEFTRPIPMIEVDVEGTAALLGVDTGAQTAFLVPELFASLENPPDTVDAQISTPDGLIPGVYGVLGSLAIGGVSHDDVDFVSFESIQLDAVVEEGWPIEGLIGGTTLVRHLVTFDEERGELTLQPYDTATQQALLDELRSSLVAGRASPALPRRVQVW